MFLFAAPLKQFAKSPKIFQNVSDSCILQIPQAGWGNPTWLLHKKLRVEPPGWQTASALLCPGGSTAVLWTCPRFGLGCPPPNRPCGPRWAAVGVGRRPGALASDPPVLHRLRQQLRAPRQLQVWPRRGRWAGAIRLQSDAPAPDVPVPR